MHALRITASVERRGIDTERITQNICGGNCEEGAVSSSRYYEPECTANPANTSRGGKWENHLPGAGWRPPRTLLGTNYVETKQPGFFDPFGKQQSIKKNDQVILRILNQKRSYIFHDYVKILALPLRKTIYNEASRSPKMPRPATLKPGVYHGLNKKPPFFEGWYYKLVSRG
jgi:hypothetical protein